MSGCFGGCFEGGSVFILAVFCLLGRDSSCSESSSMEPGHCWMVGFRTQCAFLLKLHKTRRCFLSSFMQSAYVSKTSGDETMNGLSLMSSPTMFLMPACSLQPRSTFAPFYLL